MFQLLPTMSGRQLLNGRCSQLHVRTAAHAARPLAFNKGLPQKAFLLTPLESSVSLSLRGCATAQYAGSMSSDPSEAGTTVHAPGSHRCDHRLWGHDGSSTSSISSNADGTGSHSRYNTDLHSSSSSSGGARGNVNDIRYTTYLRGSCSSIDVGAASSSGRSSGSGTISSGSGLLNRNGSSDWSGADSCWRFGSSLHNCRSSSSSRRRRSGAGNQSMYSGAVFRSSSSSSSSSSFASHGPYISSSTGFLDSRCSVERRCSGSSSGSRIAARSLARSKARMPAQGDAVVAMASSNEEADHFAAQEVIDITHKGNKINEEARMVTRSDLPPPETALHVAGMDGLLQDVAAELSLITTPSGQMATKANTDAQHRILEQPANYNLTYRGAKPDIFHDPGNIVPLVRYWLGHILEQWSQAGVHKVVPLYIAGPIKSGKSFVLQSIIPALAATYEDGIFIEKGALVMHLNLLDLSITEGVDVMLNEICDLIVQWARAIGFESWAVHNLATRDRAASKAALRGFFKKLDRHVFILIDEVQRPLLPKLPSGALDTSSQESMRVLMKLLFYESSLNCLWAVTGSSTAFFWVQLGLMPRNGYTPLGHNITVSMPPVHEKEAVTQVLKRLLHNAGMESSPGNPPYQQLLKFDNSALLSYAFRQCRTWPGKDMAYVLIDLLLDKLASESLADWGAVLEGFTVEQRQLAAGLYNGHKGCDLSVLGSVGLMKFLEPMTAPVTGTNAQYLTGVYYREALGRILQPDGTIIPVTDIPAMYNPLGFQDVLVHLLPWGQIAQDLVKKTNQRSVNLLENLLNGPALELEEKCKAAADDWCEQAWFQEVWFSKFNQADRKRPVHSIGEIQPGCSAWDYLQARETAHQQNKPMSAARHLAWYLVMLRNDIADNNRTTVSLDPDRRAVFEMVNDSPVCNPPSTLLQRFSAMHEYAAWKEQQQPSHLRRSGQNQSQQQQPQVQQEH